MITKKIIDVKLLRFPWQTKDPFLFCAHHRDKYPKGNEKMGIDLEDLRGRNIGEDFTIKDGWRMYHGTSIPGFPVHPHRGFETITINKEGFVDHSDSLGAAGRFGAGDVQWMTAGKGIQHSEMFPLIYRDKENHLELFQVWLNLPRASKFVEPYFKMLWQDMIPMIQETDINGRTTEINIIAGNLNGVQSPSPTPDSWASDPNNNVAIFTIKMEANANWKLPAASEEVNRTLYFYRGHTINIENQTIKGYHLIEVNPSEEIEINNGSKDAYFLLLQGKPINEPVVKYGPFVMNTKTEIEEAFSDYQRTHFGGWSWSEHEQVHDRDKGRFALHANGKEEVAKF